jgi:tRNA(Ile)-lysidine synthase
MAMAAFSPAALVSVLQGIVPDPAADAPAALCVALSGGLDSTALLAALARSRFSAGEDFPFSRLRAIHINHQLSADAARWEEACVELAARLGVDFSAERVQVTAAARAGVEAAARDARYAALRRCVLPGEILLTAHHADDQLETFLLALMRGSGVRGLASMPLCAQFGRGWHARPLLKFSREQVAQWAQSQGLNGVQDPMNADPRFARSYLRSEVLPRLTTRWPAAVFSAVRSAAHVADAGELLDELAADDLGKASATGSSISVAAMRALTSARRRNLLRYWLRSRGLAVPTAAELASLEHDMLRAQADRCPCARWPGAEVHRYRDRLYAFAALPPARARAAVAWSWREQPLDLGPGLGSLIAIAGTAAGAGKALAVNRLPARLQIGYRGGGEQLRLAGQTQHKKLKKLLQAAGILPWWRERVPLLQAGERLAAVADLFVTAEFAARPDEAGVSIVWQDRPQILAS